MLSSSGKFRLVALRNHENTDPKLWTGSGLKMLELVQVPGSVSCKVEKFGRKISRRVGDGRRNTTVGREAGSE